MLTDFFDFLGGKAPDMEQEECEAFIDAVVYSMMIDRMIDENEAAKIKKEANRLPWKSPSPVVDYITGSIRKAGNNLNFQRQAEPYCGEIAGKIRSKEAREFTRKACLKVMHSDGEFKPVEKALEQLIDQAFGE
jgi:tellurite resistance protein